VTVGVPQRWHVYVVDLEPRVGTKPGKQGPCLAVQPVEFGEAGLRSHHRRSAAPAAAITVVENYTDRTFEARPRWHRPGGRLPV
jgi:mRNA-degrading endonuclease toxin of MazEF toxin-antitoxin module